MIMRVFTRFVNYFRKRLPCEGKGNKYEYKPNGNMAAGILKDRLIRAIIVDDPALRAEMLDKLVNDISRFVVPIIPDRHNHRKMTKARPTRKRKNPL